MIQPLQGIPCITARKLNFATRKERRVNTAKSLEQKRIYKRGEPEFEHRYISVMDRQGHDKNFAAFCQNISCPVKNEFSSRSGRNPITSSAHKDGETYVIF